MAGEQWSDFQSAQIEPNKIRESCSIHALLAAVYKAIIYIIGRANYLFAIFLEYSTLSTLSLSI